MFQSFDTHSEGAKAADRLTLLRAAMATEGVDGFIVPRADAHQGEYVPPRDERLAWISGFTGSAGFAVILKNEAALFVDGRYTIQSRQQVDEDLFEIVPIHTMPVSEWVLSCAPGKIRLAYDPWLHGKAEIEKIGAAVAARRGQMVAAENLIDRVWADQPAPPRKPLRTHPEEFAGESSAAKRARLSHELAEAGATATVLTLPDSIAWLLNVRGADISRNPVPLVFAILHASGAVDLFADASQVSEDVASHLGGDITRRDPASLQEALQDFGDQTVALDKTSCPVAIAQLLESGGARIVWRPDPCILPKAQKNTAELDGARAAHRRDGAAVSRFLRWLDEEAPKGHLTEIDIATRLEAERRSTNALLDISFDTIVGSGPNGAICHYHVDSEGNRQLNAGELMLVDSGGQYQDGTTDITRTIWTGEPPAGAVRAYTLVLKGMISLSTARFPVGTNGRDLDVLARIALWRQGMDYDHGTGHGVGSHLCVHEGPARISRAGAVNLLPGMILSNEPGYYAEDAFGIRTENLIIVTEAEVPEGGDRPMLGFETLTLAPIDKRLIDPAILTAEEITWLNEYHARVLAEIGPQLSGGDLEWLNKACAPLEQ
ncbi:MAG: aminopeptidase P family protein [Pikeienuella sp.]